MTDLSPAQLTLASGIVMTTIVTLVAPESRWRMVAVWVLLGTVVAVVVAGLLQVAFMPGATSASVTRASPDPWPPRVADYALYSASVLLLIGAWSASMRVASSPVHEVWRAGKGTIAEHVAPHEQPWRRVARLALALVCLAAVALACGWLDGLPLI